MVGKRVRMRNGNKTPAYDGLDGTITSIRPNGTYPFYIRLDGYSWDVCFDRDEFELPDDPLPLPG